MSSISFNSYKPRNVSSESYMPPHEANLTPPQIAGIVISVVSAVSFFVVLAIAIRWYTRWRRPYHAEQGQKRDSAAPLGDFTSPRERGDTESQRRSSSIWGDMGDATMRPASTLSSGALDSRHWPLPPGHLDRYTFFSDRSSTSVDDTLAVEPPRSGSRPDKGKGRASYLTVPGRGSNMGNRSESRVESIWGISEAAKAHLK
ncbi:hypothetical protein F4819DRAFT_334196 [Hypoxylon fuscum]|nr:hypothetical protein F4819DRAFT_334196 [Hypoxylon fuscum]